MDNSFVLILWLGIFFCLFFLSVCLRVPFVSHFSYKKQDTLDEICWRDQKEIFCTGRRLHVFGSTLFPFFLNEKKDIWFLQWKQNWRCIVSLCLSSPSLIEVRIMPNSLGGRKGRQFCLCMCHQIMFVLFFSLEISNNRIWWSCFSSFYLKES